MHVSKHIQKCTPQLALEVGLNLRPEDKREVEQTMGLVAPVAVLQSYYNSAYSVYFTSPRGKAVGVAGVTPGNIIWMLCTEESDKIPHTFVREARRWVNGLANPYLYNHCDMRNENHVKLLKLLGFTFINYYVQNGVPLISFIKSCALPSSES